MDGVVRAGAPHMARGGLFRHDKHVSVGGIHARITVSVSYLPVQDVHGCLVGWSLRGSLGLGAGTVVEGITQALGYVWRPAPAVRRW